MNNRLDYWLIQHWGMTHPPIWAMWLSIFMSWVAFCNVLGRKSK